MRAVTIYGTSECNLRCKHCAVGGDQNHPRPQLTTNDLKEVLSKLGENGTRFITFLGGEITLFRTDLKEVLEHAANVGLNIAINTNLTEIHGVEPLLSSEALVGLIVSVDGAASETHDFVRGRGTFARTTENLKRVASHPRAHSGDLIVEIAYVLTAISSSDAGRMVSVARAIGAQRLRVNPVKIMGRAGDFEQKLTLSSSALIDAYEQIVISWLLDGTIELDLYLPPAVALYFNRKWGISLPIEAHAACGGIDEFGYVDSYGNLLPCPGRSFEENPDGGFSGSQPSINLLQTNVQSAHQTSIFVEFEKNRKSRGNLKFMDPCRKCRFKNACFPCTSDLTLGRDHVQVDICKAVFEHCRNDFPELYSKLFSC